MVKNFLAKKVTDFIGNACDEEGPGYDLIVITPTWCYGMAIVPTPVKGMPGTNNILGQLYKYSMQWQMATISQMSLVAFRH